MRLPRATRILKRVFKKCDGIDFDLEKPRINLFSSVYVSMYFCSHTGLLPNLVNKLFCFLCILWQYGLLNFQEESSKLKRFLHKNQHTRRKFLNFENWTNGEVSKSAKSPNLLTFKVNFLYQKLSESFSIFFFFIEEYQFRSTFFVIVIF